MSQPLPEWVAWTGAAGVTLIVSTSNLFRPLRAALLRGHGPARFLGAMLRCCMCFGFWVGLLFGWARGHNPVDWILAGGAVSLLAYAADLALTRLGEGMEDDDHDEP